MRNCLGRTLAVLVVGVILQGCTAGRLLDGSTGVAVEGVTVELISGDCEGPGCGTPHATVQTNAGGFFLFDPYDPLSGQFLSPLPEQEAMTLRISKPGYETVTVYHRPAYDTIRFKGRRYLFSYVGNLYLCLDPSLDSDGDSICDDAEVHYGTNPDDPDTDGDSLSDAAEIYGYNQVDLAFFGADPRRKDVLLEIDYYPGLGPEPEAVALVVEAFASAPVSNPDGTTGINLAVDMSDEVAPEDADPNLSPVFSEFAPIRNKYFTARRSALFHYGLFANQIMSANYSGISTGVPGRDFIVSLGSEWIVPYAWMLARAGTLMHELGHNLGLEHGGFSDARNHKANYFSVMNYNYQVLGLRQDGDNGVLDYSRLRIDAVDETEVNERLAFAPVQGSGTTEAELDRYGVLLWNVGWLNGTASGNLDFNRNGIIEEQVAVDLDATGSVGWVIPASGNDWDNLFFNGGGLIGDSHLGAGELALGRSPGAEAPGPHEACEAPFDAAFLQALLPPGIVEP